MIKRALLLTTLLITSPAYADAPVIDFAAIYDRAQSYIQEGKQLATEIEQLKTEAQTLGYTITQVQSMIADPNLANAMGLLQTLGVSDPLPVSPYAVQSLVTGQGGLSGALGNLSGLVSSAAASNHIYTNNDGTWASQQSAARANGVAGAQGIAEQIHQQMAARFPLIASLRADMLNATTPAEREHVAGQIAVEQAWTANANAQLQAATVLVSVQRDNREQQADEHLNQSLDNQIAQAKARGYIQ